MKKTFVSNQQNWLIWKGIAPNGIRNESVHGGCHIRRGLASLNPTVRCNFRTSTGENGFPPSISSRDDAQKATKSVIGPILESVCESASRTGRSSAQKKQIIAQQHTLERNILLLIERLVICFGRRL
jgi:hypothetical protein